MPNVEEVEAVEEQRAPGMISPEDLVTLYNATKIELRAANEQKDALGQWVMMVTELLGVESPEAALAEITKLKANRATRRAPARKTATHKTGTRRKKK
jgi:hypothetical protein